ncbi:hypothetical protein CLOM_g12613 [Closterium sp. NIES-68]|nr:hypothetical protein CLOM_g12613 [Closterium sp. NIES-68]
MRTGDRVIETRRASEDPSKEPSRSRAIDSRKQHQQQPKQQQQKQQPACVQVKVGELEGFSRAVVDELGGISRTKVNELGGISRAVADELGGVSRAVADELEIVREEKRSLEKSLKLVVEERDALLELAARNVAVAAKKEKERTIITREAVFESTQSPPHPTGASKVGESLAATADRAGKSGGSAERALQRRSRPHSVERIPSESGDRSLRRSADGRPHSAERGPRRAEIADGETADWKGGASALIALALEKERENKWEMEYRREIRNGEAKRDFLREERKRQLGREMAKVKGAAGGGEKPGHIQEKRAVEMGRQDQNQLHGEARREWSHGKVTESAERRRSVERANAKRESDREQRKGRERTRERERAEQREREKERSEERAKDLRREAERRREQERERVRHLEREKEREEEREQEQKREAEREREWWKEKAQAEAWEKECERLSEEVERLHELLQQARSELAVARRIDAGAAQAGGESAGADVAKELEQTKLRLAKVEAERGQLASAVERMVLEMADAVREQEQFREALQHTSLDTMLLSHALGSVKTLQSTVHLMQQQLHREALEKATLAEKLAKLQSQRSLEAVKHQAYASSIHSLLSSLMLRFNFDRDPLIRNALEEANRTAHNMADTASQLLEACNSAAPSNPLNAASNLYRLGPLGHESTHSLATVVPLPLSESAPAPDHDASALPKRSQKRTVMSAAWKLLMTHGSK